MKRVSVFVGGIRSVLQSQESEEYIRHVASRADLMLRTVKHENPALTTDKAAVLALINAVDRMERQDHFKDEKRELSLQERRKIERLEAALSSAKEIIHETQARLEEYQARDQLLEAGLIPLGSPACVIDRADANEDEIEISPDQLSFSQYLGDESIADDEDEDTYYG